MKSLLLICFFALFCPKVNGGSVSAINPDGATTITATVGKTRLDVVFHTSSVNVSQGDKIPRFAQCTYSKIPCVLTRQVKLLVNGEDLFLPRSAYADLGDIQSAQILLQGEKFELIVKGGDASEAYIAHILFDRRRVLGRRLFSAGDTSHALESIQYYEVSTRD